jgi:uncharacterized membrane protein
MKAIILKISLAGVVFLAVAILLIVLHIHGTISPRLLGVGLAIDCLGLFAASMIMSGNARINASTQPRNVTVNHPFTLMGCYVAGVLFPLIYLTSEPYKHDKAIRFHSFQSIIFFVLFFAVRLISSVSSPAGQVGRIVEIVFFLTWLVLMISTYRGKRIRLPLIGKIAEQKAGLMR